MSFCSVTIISTKRRHTFSMKFTTLLRSASLGSCSRGGSSLGGRRFRLDRAGKRQIARDELFLERGALALKTRDLCLQRRALVRHRLTRPPYRSLGTHRYLAGTPVKPHISVIDAVEGVAGVGPLGRRALRPSRRPGEGQSGDREQSHADHEVPPASPSIAMVLRRSPRHAPPYEPKRSVGGRLPSPGRRSNRNMRLRAERRRRVPARAWNRPKRACRCFADGVDFILILSRLTASAPILDSYGPSQYGPRGLGAAEVLRSCLNRRGCRKHGRRRTRKRRSRTTSA